MRESFPSLFLDRAGWQGLSAKLADPFFARLHDDNLRALACLDAEKNGDDITDVPYTLGSGDPRPVNIPARVLKNLVQRCTAAWFVTGERRHLDRAVASVDVAIERGHWRVPPGSDGLHAANLHTGDLIYTVAFAIDALAADLDDATVTRWLDALVERGLQTYIDGVRLRDWWDTTPWNWAGGLHAQAGMGALVASRHAPEIAERIIAHARRRLPLLIASFLPGGGYTEGVMYQATAIGHLTDFVRPLQRLRGDDLGLLTNGAFHDTIDLLAQFDAPDGGVYNFSNVNAHGVEIGSAHLYHWARMLDRPQWTAWQDARTRPWNDTHQLFYDVEAFWYRDAHQPRVEPERHRFHHFPVLHWATWRGNRTWLAFKGGNNGGGHNNRDLGSFILGCGGERFLIDPGYGQARTDMHNCIVVGECDQAQEANAPILRSQERDDGFYIHCDLIETAANKLAHFRRHLLLVGEEHLIVLDDALAKRYFANTRWYLQTRLAFEETAEGWLIRGREAELRVHLLDEVGWKKSRAWDYEGPINALVWREAANERHTVHPMVLSFGTPEVGCRWLDGGVDVLIDGRAYQWRSRDGILDFIGDATAG